jgi:peptidoglycan/xylan/chitin deacetylase (PgdA/CDA1 family)
VTVKLARLAMVVLTCFVAGACGISLHPPASWLAHHAETAEVVLPDPVKPRPNPKLPAVKTGPLILAPGQTVVSLTFDDGRASNTLGAKILTERDLAGTFFLNSGNIGKPGYLTLAQVDQMAAQGQEIAGHTVNHKDLGELTLNEVTNEICGDRDTWLAWGFPVRNFAYPFSSASPEIKQIVRDCGYNSARTLGETRTAHMPENVTAEDCALCPWSESVPPDHMFYTRAPAQIRSNWTLDDLKAQVTAATERNGNAYSGDGGWVQLTFHGICPSDCIDIGIDHSIFEQFVDWLADQQAQGKLVVRTVGEVIGGNVAPAVPVPPPPTSVVDAGLEEGGPDGIPRCWMRSSFGESKPEFSVVPGHSGKGEKVVVRDYHDGEVGLLSAQDLGTCAVAVTPGQTPTISAWYRSTVPTRFSVQYRTDRGNWFYSTSGPVLPASNGWTQATRKVPPAPRGATAISFGLMIAQNGEITTDDYELRR